MPSVDDDLRDLAASLTRDVDTSSTLDAARRRALQRRRARPLKIAALSVAVSAVLVAGFVPAFVAFRGSHKTPIAPASTSPSPSRFSMEGRFAIIGTPAGQSEGRLYTVTAESAPHELVSGVGLDPSWSPNGSRILVNKPISESSNELVIVNATTGATTTVTAFQAPGAGAWSPRDDEIAFPTQYGDIYTVRPDGSGLTQLTHPGGSCTDAGISWSPDASQIAFARQCEGGGEPGIYVIGADGSNAHRIAENGRVLETTWSPSGSTLAFSQWEEPQVDAVYLMGTDGAGLRRVAWNAHSPSWSPDGNAVAVVQSAKVTIVDRTGKTVDTLETASDLTVSSISWSGASS